MSFVLLAYTLCRLIFLLLNQSHFESTDLFWAFLGGIRFDLSAIALSNALTLLLCLIPFPWLSSVRYQRFIDLLIIVINFPAILLNLIDTEYFKFTSKRSTADFFDLMFLGDDMWTLLPSYLRDFWYLPLGLIVALFLTFRFLIPKERPASSIPKVNYLWQSLFLILSVGVAVLGARGGTQLRPINKLSAMDYGKARDIPLIINTPFSIMKSWNKEFLKRKEYFSDEEVKEHFDPVKELKASAEPKKKNIVIIIMESFSKEYVGRSNEKGLAYTPFLDSLSSVSKTFDLSYANGRTSIGALPSIIAGLPVMMEEPYITSQYGSSSIDALPAILAEHGYHSSFFHGGKRGTMGFDRFCKTAGVNRYYGLEDYPDQADYDGNWGIYDGPFFQFAAEEMGKNEPFISTLFSLSSHHPYSIPENLTANYEGFEHGLGRSIRYADDALKELFEAMEKSDYFENSLFIITADHIPGTATPEFNTFLGSFSVPIVFYDPNSGFNSECSIAQHIDIQETVVEYLGLETEFIGFGKSLISCETDWSVQYLNNMYQLHEKGYVLRYDGGNIVELYRSPNLSKVIQEPELQDQMLKKLKAMIQQNHNRMIDNSLTSGR